MRSAGHSSRRNNIYDKLPNKLYHLILIQFFFSPFYTSSQEFYTDNPKTFDDYGRIINQRHFRRVMALMEGGEVAVGGDSDESECYIGTSWV